MDRNHPNYKQFKQEFWLWFDNLPKAKKKVFWGYKHDMAEANFYFTQWERRNEKNHS